MLARPQPGLVEECVLSHQVGSIQNLDLAQVREDARKSQVGSSAKRPVKLKFVGMAVAGMSAAARARRLDEQAETNVLECGENISYAN